MTDDRQAVLDALLATIDDDRIGEKIEIRIPYFGANTTTVGQDHLDHVTAAYIEATNDIRRTLLTESFTVGGYVGSGVIAFEDAKVALVRAGLAADLPEADVVRIVDLGLAKGSEMPIYEDPA